jgi:hypothetical protein
MRKLFIVAGFSLLSISVFAQELNCQVSINPSQVQTADQGIFRDMKTAIEQFMNGRKWTDNDFQNHEKIDCSIQITITKMPAIGSFSATVQVQSARPVFNTNYSTLVFNYADRDWDFEYIESLPLNFNENTYTSNLTSMLAFYDFLIIGYDYDTFSELGGSPYFQKSLAVVNNAQQSNRSGWQPLGSNRNRYWINENLNNGQYTEMRKMFYSYHRLALDTYENDPENSRTVILQGLQEVKKIRDINPNSILVVSFFDAKSKEIANIFSEGNIQVRRQAYDLMVTIDPSNKGNYEKMIKN